ncbi:MAG: tetratricopeptide repeat protein [Phycisphaerae bacterium]
MSACPSDAELGEILAGRSGSEALRAHIGSCDVCRARRDALEHDGRLWRELRGAVTPASGAGGAADVPRAAGEIDQFPGYELVELIDRGGQGVVYKAIQKSTRRTVALKVLASGVFATTRQRQRFQREIELVGRLQHRNIITVFDSGVSAAGRDFCVMQYIDGTPLDEYFARGAAADSPAGAGVLERRSWARASTLRRGLRAVRHGPPAIAELVALFTKLCDAVHAAHLRGIIHRDLKPANILIDASGEPNILDFGLAKVVDASAAGGARDVTASGDFVGTLAYASPEQTSGDPAAVDSRTDIYSLGVMLYELLSGRRPCDVTGGLQQALDNIRNVDPAPPSRYCRDVDDELDTIVLLALHKDPARRYATVDALARDLRHYLAGEAIDAKRDSGWYVLRKTVQRHRAPVALAAGLVLVVLAFGVTMGVLYQRARAAETLAREQQTAAQEAAARATQVQKLLEGALRSVRPGEARGRDVSLLREVLDEAARRIDTELVGQPEAEIALRETIATTYERIGLHEETERHVRRSIALRRALHGNDDTGLVAPLNLLSISLRELARHDEAEAAAREAVALARTHPEADGSEAVSATQNLAGALRAQGRAADADPIYREAHALALRHFGFDAIITAQMLDARASVARDLGRVDEAETLYRDALKVLRAQYPDGHPATTLSINNLARLLAARGRYDEAEPLFREVLAAHRKWLGERHPALAEVLSDLGTLLLARGDVSAAEPVLSEAVQVLRALGRADHPDLAYALHTLGVVRYRLENHLHAEDALREALAIRRARLGDHRFTFMTAGELGRCLTAQERYAEAEPLLLDAYCGLAGLMGERHAYARTQAERLARLYERWGRSEEAEAYRQASVAATAQAAER